MHSVSYDTIVRHFTEERIAERYSFLEKKMNDFIEASGNEGIAECNPDILQHVIMDYFAAIFRLKNFHFIDKVNIVKITAYTVAWIIRRKPIVLIKTLSEDNDKDIFFFCNDSFWIDTNIKEFFTWFRPSVGKVPG